VISEAYQSKIDLILENLETIERRVRKDLNDFRQEVYEKFTLVDLRFDHLEKKMTSSEIG
jgi:hypothetical protein